MIITLVLVLAIGGLGTAAFLVFRDGDPVPGSTPGITFPEKWDDRILPFTKIAAKERGLEFKHPVEVRFLDPKKFVEEQRSEEEELTEEDKVEIEQTTGLFRAIGLISGKVDLVKAFRDFRDSGTLAYYDTKTKKITVRGTTITPSMRVTLVHELVHVLQDQHFNIGARVEELSKDEDDVDSQDSEATVLDAVIEGDASRIETQYRDSLSAKEREELEDSEKGQRDDASEAYAKIPKVVVTLQLAPYILGEAVVTAVAEKGGNGDVDDLFTNTPKHEAALLDAFEVLQDDTGAEAVEVPGLGAGEEKFDAGEFGSLTLFFVLSERIDMKKALAAADGWNGDRYVGFTRDGVSCVKVDVVGDSEESAELLESALTDWRAAGKGSVVVERDGDTVRFESCDPGTQGPAGKDVSQEALRLVTARTNLGVSLLSEGSPASFAGCLSSALIREFTLAQVFDADLAENDPAAVQRIRALAAGCQQGRS